MRVAKFLLEKEKREQKENSTKTKVHLTCLEENKSKDTMEFFPHVYSDCIGEEKGERIQCTLKQLLNTIIRAVRSLKLVKHSAWKTPPAGVLQIAGKFCNTKAKPLLMNEKMG